jgi:DNA-binding transcriptional LysR family regulator
MKYDFSNSDIRRLDGGLLLIFRELLRHRRATETADALGLSQSAVSQALGRLRDIYRDPLFVRRPHGLEPTARALALAPRIEALIDLAGATLAREAAFNPAESDRRFRMIAPEFVIALIGARLVQRLRTVAPRVSFRAQSLPHELAFDAIKRGETDLAVGRFGAHPPGFAKDILFDDRYCVVARRGHPRFRGRISYAQYRTAGHIYSFAPGEGGESDDVAPEDSAAANAIVPRWLNALVMVSSCDAIATVPRRLAERLAPVLGLAVLSAPFVQDKISVSTIRRAAIEDPGADWFLSEVRIAAA